MMRGRTNVAVAVRRPNGEIALREERLSSLFTGKVRDLPFIRGPLVLIETLILGIRCLMYSASVVVEEEDLEVTPKMLWGVVGIGFLLALVLFLILPLVAVRFLDPYVTDVQSNVIDGVLRLVIFLVYLRVISFMPDIRRVFAYHGAEHKTINAYEAGEELVVDSVRKYGTAHYRCGTAFILIVLVLAIVVQAFLGRPDLWLRILERLALLPAIGAVSYEMLRFSANHMTNSLVRLLVKPGLTLQAMTTREPDDSQIEVAISALKRTIAADSGTLQVAEETAPASGVTGGTDRVHL